MREGGRVTVWVPTVHDHDPLCCVDLHDLQALDSIPLPAHVPRHLLAGIHPAATTLPLTRRTHTPVSERDTMRSVLPVHSPPLHHALEAFALAVTPRVDELAHHEPIRRDLLAHRQ